MEANTKIVIPDNINFAIDKLDNNGHESFIVGGCLRDIFLGLKPDDWDVCTSAKLDEIVRCFRDYEVIETGIKHGTVTVIIDGKSIEITTFRSSSDSLREDLSKRDFTFNSLAYSRDTGLIDYFGGLSDLRECMIRAVGDANQRFDEDALRILRAVRFVAQFGFVIDTKTYNQMFENKGLLQNISVERITSEFNKMLCHGENSRLALDKYSDIIFEIIPEARDMYGFKQWNSYHEYDVWEHTLKAVSVVGDDLLLNLTMFFHDIGKPHCFTRDDNGVGHFYRHELIGANLTERIMIRMRYDNQMIKSVKLLIENHRYKFEPDSIQLKRLLSKIGEANVRRLIQIKISDIKSQNSDWIDNRLKKMNDVEKVLLEIIAQDQCLSLKELKIDGNDLMAAGIKEGETIGLILSNLLEMVIEERLQNDKDQLLEMADRLYSHLS